MIFSANRRESGRRFFHTHVAFCNQQDKSGMPKNHNCVCTEVLSRARRHSRNALLLWRTLRYSHLNRTNPLWIAAAPFPAPLDRHSKSDIIQAQGQAVKTLSCSSSSFFQGESQFLCVCISGMPDMHPK